MSRRGTRNTESASLYSSTRDRALRPEELDAIAKESDRLLALEKELREREEKLIEDERHVKYCTELYARLPYEEEELRAREKALEKLEFAFQLDVADGKFNSSIRTSGGNETEASWTLVERLQETEATEQRMIEEAQEAQKVASEAIDSLKVAKAFESVQAADHLQMVMRMESEEAKQSRELAELRKRHEDLYLEGSLPSSGKGLTESLLKIHAEEEADLNAVARLRDENAKLEERALTTCHSKDDQAAFQEAEIQDLTELLWAVESEEEAEFKEVVRLREENAELEEQGPSLLSVMHPADFITTLEASVVKAEHETRECEASRLLKEEKLDECLECLGSFEFKIEDMESQLEAAHQVKKSPGAAEVLIANEFLEAEASIERLRANERQASEDASELNEVKSALQLLHSELDSCCKEHEAMRATWAEEKQALVHESSEAQSDVQRLRKQRNQLQSDATRLREQRQQLEKEHADALESEKAMEAQFFMEKEACVSQLELEVSEQRKIHEASTKEFAATQEEWFKERSRLQEQVEKLASDVSRLRENRNRLRDQRAQGTEIEDALRSEVEKRTDALTALRSEFDRAEQSVSELRSEMQANAEEDERDEPTGSNTPMIDVDAVEDDFKLPSIHQRSPVSPSGRPSPKGKRRRVTVAQLHRQLRARDQELSDLRRQLYKANYEKQPKHGKENRDMLL